MNKGKQDQQEITPTLLNSKASVSHKSNNLYTIVFLSPPITQCTRGTYHMGPDTSQRIEGGHTPLHTLQRSLARRLPHIFETILFPESNFFRSTQKYSVFYLLFLAISLDPSF